jgi:ABC-type polysaccharide/polyol phosphate transport system ATPase subunit
LFKALDDVNFSIEPGEIVGIIGHNGAGKSTLLKHLARIIQPTRGAVRVKGSVAPLIEVGAGFVAEFTGRENIYLNASILGMSRKQIARKIDEIIEFAELEEFIDTPVKRYSSGMQIRLGFAVATSIDSDILIVDEVLAVGDLAFQRKCFDRMEEIIRRQNRTVLLVSHNIRQVARLCTRAILLEHGKISRDGNPEEVCTLFYEHANAKIESYQAASKLAQAQVDSSDEVELLSVNVVDATGAPIEEIASCDPLRVRVAFRLHEPVSEAEMIVGTHSTDFVYLSAGSTGVHDTRPDLAPGDHEVEYMIPYFPLVPGVYCIRFSLYDAFKRPLFIGETLKTFKVSGTSHEVREPGSRTLHIPASWHLDGRPYPPQSV